jgi:hypothetical protein
MLFHVVGLLENLNGPRSKDVTRAHNRTPLSGVLDPAEPRVERSSIHRLPYLVQKAAR